MLNQIISFNDLSTIISLIISLVSLIISIVALKISKDVVVYSSKDYEPQLIVTINEDDEVKVINNSTKLFSIIDMSLIRVKTVGFEDFEKKVVVRMPLLIISKFCPNINGKKKAIINSNSVGPCAFQQCPIDITLIKQIEDKIQLEYMQPFLNGQEGRGYAYPSFQSDTYYLVVTYENRFQERKQVYYNKQHYHGTGYINSKVSYESLEAFLKYIEIPKIEDFDTLWNYLYNKYKIPNKEFWKAS